MRLDGAEHPAHLHVLHGGVLEVLGDGALHVVDLTGEADDPVGQPAVAGLHRRHPQVGVAVEHPADQHVGQQALGAPDVGGGAGHGHVAPDVAVAGEVGGLVEEAVVHDGQVGLVHGRPHRLQVGVVHRQALGQHRPHRGQPLPVGVFFDHGRGGGRVGAGGQHQPLEPAGVGGAVVVHVAVVGPVHRQGQRRVQGGGAGGPGAGDQQVDVDALHVHVGQPPGGVAVLDAVGYRLEGQVLHPALQRPPGPGPPGVGLVVLLVAGHPVVGVGVDPHHPVRVSGVAPARRGFGDPDVGLEFALAVEQLGVGVGEQVLDGRSDVGVGVDHPVALAHGLSD